MAWNWTTNRRQIIICTNFTSKSSKDHLQQENDYKDIYCYTETLPSLPRIPWILSCLKPFTYTVNRTPKPEYYTGTFTHSTYLLTAPLGDFRNQHYYYSYFSYTQLYTNRHMKPEKYSQYSDIPIPPQTRQLSLHYPAYSHWIIKKVL